MYFYSVHPCDKSESPCKNEGVCEKDEDEFICKCTEDWTGKTCEIKGKISFQVKTSTMLKIVGISKTGLIIATNPTTSKFQLPFFQFGHAIVPLVKMTPSARTNVAFTCAIVEKVTKVFSVKIKVLFLGLSFSS